MSEVKNFKCDECGCLLPNIGRPNNTIHGGITGATISICITLNYNEKFKDMRLEKYGLDFCDLEHLTSYIAFAITEYFMEHCEGESNKNE